MTELTKSKIDKALKRIKPNEVYDEWPEDYPYQLPPGPWKHEPVKVVWVDEATGLDCMMVRGSQGNWCGYVGVSEGHPAFGVNYSSPIDHKAGSCREKSYPEQEHFWCEHELGSIFRVHGGLTFSDYCMPDPENPETAICHVHQDGRPEKVWWLGFDCLHAFDYGPVMEEAMKRFGPYPALDEMKTYRDMIYVIGEVEDLAQQIKAYAQEQP